MDLNIVAITGRLAADPELHSTGNGTDVTTLRIAVGRMKRQGEQRADADFVDVVVWGEQAKHAGRYLAKGRRVAIKGRLQQRTWTTPEGAKRSRLQIVADQVQFLDYKDRAGDDTSQVPDEPEPSTTPEAEGAEVASDRSSRLEAPADAAAQDTTAQEPVETPEQPTADGARRASRRKKAAQAVAVTVAPASCWGHGPVSTPGKSGPGPPWPTARPISGAGLRPAAASSSRRAPPA